MTRPQGTTLRRSLVSATAAATLALVVALTLTAGATGAPRRASGTLLLHAVFRLSPTPVDCPPGTPTTTECLQVSGSATVPGLGQVTEGYEILLDLGDPQCVHASWMAVAITVAGKGEIDASLKDPYTCDPSASASAMAPFTITAGSGIYAGASGSGTLVNVSRTDTWTGTLTAPGFDFDTTSPTISGAISKTVRARKRVKRVRVTFKVSAKDAVDGPVPVTCDPSSGSRFRIGRTRVVCSATDSSGNTATATFTVTVKRR